LLATILFFSLLTSCRAVAPGLTDPSQNGQTTTDNNDPSAPSADGNTNTEGTDNPIGPGEDGVWLPTEPADDEGFPDDGVRYVRYSVNYGPAGTIKNGGLHRLIGHSQPVEAIANFGYRFVRWSDGVTDPARTDSLVDLSENTVITAIFDYDVLDMPVVAIDTSTGYEVQSKTEYIDAGFRIYNCSAFDQIDKTVQIRGRGNNTWGYAKKSYKIKFSEKVNLLGLGTKSDKVWVLLANVCDQSLMRNHVAFELARSLDGVAFSPASMSVDVYLNGEYRGVYLLAEEIRDSKARVNIDTDGFETQTDIGYLVELSNYASGEVIYPGGRSYKIHSDLSSNSKVREAQKKYITDYMERCLNALKNGNRAEIEALMDISSIVDIYLTEEVVKNLDTGWDNFYLYKEKGGKLFVGPVWDFDLSLGNANEGSETIDGLFAATRSGSGGGSPWLYQAMELEWFRELVVERWDEVKTTHIDTIPGTVREEGSSKLRSYERNFVRWPIFGTTQNRETETIRQLKNYTEHYEHLASWIEQRIAWLDETYHLPDFTTMSFTGGGHDGGGDKNGGFFDENTEALFNSMTDLITEVGVESVVSTVDGFGGEGVENLFDGNKGTKYCWESWDDITEITFTMKKGVSPTHYALMTANDTSSYPDRNPLMWTIYGSNDGENWDEIANVEDGRYLLATANYVWSVFAFDATGTYSSYKAVIVNDGVVQFGEMALLG